MATTLERVHVSCPAFGRALSLIVCVLARPPDFGADVVSDNVLTRASRRCSSGQRILLLRTGINLIRSRAHHVNKATSTRTSARAEAVCERGHGNLHGTFEQIAWGNPPRQRSRCRTPCVITLRGNTVPCSHPHNASASSSPAKLWQRQWFCCPRHRLAYAASIAI